MAHSEGLPQRLRNEGKICPVQWPQPHLLNPLSDSWIEISSQPSSSSLSSIGDEIVTTGLRVHQDALPRHRRRRAPGTSSMAMETRQAGTSSQEEYEESESESDRVMTSSNEHVASSPLGATQQDYDVGSDSDGYSENATALGRRTEPVSSNHNQFFTPQPNAFSHPPSSQTSQGPLGPSCNVRRASQPNPSTCSPFPSPALARAQRSSSSQADHDAALRASLTTLLSIGAAAARGLPKRQQANPPSGNEPVSLRLVPESEIMPAANSSRPLTPSTRARSSPSISSQEAIALDKNKRKASSSSASKPSSGEKASTKKKKVRLAENAETSASLSPTLLTWVVSAGVLVLVSVVGFGAGYVIGWEVGRQEGLAGVGVNGSTILGDGTSCGREVVKGGSGTLRRFRWGSNVARSIVA
jgi:hypothetical protein